MGAHLHVFGAQTRHTALLRPPRSRTSVALVALCLLSTLCVRAGTLPRAELDALSHCRLTVGSCKNELNRRGRKLEVVQLQRVANYKKYA